VWCILNKIQEEIVFDCEQCDVFSAISFEMRCVYLQWTDI